MSTIEQQRETDEPGARARRLVGAIHDRVAVDGRGIPLRLWDGTELGPRDRGYRLVLRQPWSLRSLLVPGTDRAAGEVYVADAIDVEGSMVAALHDVATIADRDLSTLRRLGILKDALRLPRPPRRVAATSRVARLRGRRHSPVRDRAAIRHHYDVGNDFYRLFLDEALVYSCAYFADDDPTDPATDPRALDRAQQRKLELVCRKLRLRPGETLLDIGCGWGALVLHAAQHHGVRAVGITLAEEQAALARERIRSAGLEDRVEIRLADYREIDGTFDAVASVGMVEHVGADQLAGYFRIAHDRTAPGGRFLNHGITTGGRGEVRDLSADRDSFVGTYVFPDGALVPTARMVGEAEAAGFEVVDVEQLRPHYARTLRHWVHRLEQDAERGRALAGDATYRIWRAYLAGSVVGFEHNDLGVVQVLCSKDAALPLGRAWMLP